MFRQFVAKDRKNHYSQRDLLTLRPSFEADFLFLKFNLEEI